MALKNFTAGESIKASETNSNNQFLLKKIEDDAELLDEKISAVSSNISSQIVSVLGNIYPVGAIYIGTTENCPMASLFGTWEKVSSGRVLQGADDTHEAGTTIAAGLPNIKASWCYGWALNYTTGAAYAGGNLGNYESYSSGGNKICNVTRFDASHSNSIYGKSSTVQPPAYVVNVWRRTA